MTLASARLRSHLPGSVLGEATPLSGIDDTDITPPSTLAAHDAYEEAGHRPRRRRRRRVPGHRRRARAPRVPGARPLRAGRAGRRCSHRARPTLGGAPAGEPERRTAVEGRAARRVGARPGHRAGAPAPRARPGPARSRAHGSGSRTPSGAARTPAASSSRAERRARMIEAHERGTAMAVASERRVVPHDRSRDRVGLGVAWCAPPTAPSTSTSPRASRSRAPATAIRASSTRSASRPAQIMHAQANCYRSPLPEQLADAARADHALEHRLVLLHELGRGGDRGRGEARAPRHRPPERDRRAGRLPRPHLPHDGDDDLEGRRARRLPAAAGRHLRHVVPASVRVGRRRSDRGRAGARRPAPAARSRRPHRARPRRS